MNTQKPILHLNLKKEWFDKINNGEKAEEYRSRSEYWARVFVKGKIKIKGRLYLPQEVTICFSNGYSKTRRQMYVECMGYKSGFGLEKLGAIKGCLYYKIALGSIIKRLNY